MLGPLEVRVGEAWVAFEAPKQRLIFGLLLDQVGRVVSADRLLDEAWSGEPPESGLGALRYHVSKLRDVLVPGRTAVDDGPILTVGSGYRLQLEPGAIDAERFDDLRSDGLQHVAANRWEDACRVLGDALALWRGDAWHDFRYDDFAQATIARLEELRLACTEDLIDARLGRGDHIDLVSDLSELTTRHPLRERFWAQSMIALYRSGRQADAARVYETACAVLGEELGVTPNPALQHLHQQVVDQSLPFPGVTDRATDDAALPRRRSTFVGRTHDLEELAHLLATRRLVTVTGTGGVGKTSLAVECARQVAPDMDGASFVDLTLVSEPGEVQQLLVRAVSGVRAAGRATIDDAIARVGGRSHLLVLDNCEHVVDAVAGLVHVLLDACPNLTVLATSRQALRLDGEHVWVLGPLPLTTSNGDVEDSDAIHLFAERAADACGQFSIDDDNMSIVVDTCRRLDGLPLAIELAAARLRVLSLEELHERLDQRFELLVTTKRTHERHRTLWATLDWSYRLLAPPEQTMLRRLSVLRGRFDLDAVAGICGTVDIDDPDVLTLIDQLVDTSFLSLPVDSQGGFVMFETIRAFAAEQLELSDEASLVRERHARFFAAQATAKSPFGSREELAQMQRIDAEAENHVAALEWSLRNGFPHLAIQLAAGLALHWYTAARGDEALHWLVAALDEGDRSASHDRAAALSSLGLALPWLGRHEEAEAVADELDRVAAQMRTPEIDADALWVRAAAAQVTGDVLGSRRLIDLASGVLRLADHPKLSVFVWELAYRELQLGNLERAAELTDEFEALGSRHNQPLTRARVPLLRGQLADFRGDQHGALSLLRTSLGEMRRIGVVGPQVHPLRSICDTAVVAELWEVAEQAASEFLTLASSTGEIAALPHGHNALAMVALARGDIDRAAKHLADGVAVIRGTRSAVVLDQTLLTAARIAVARRRLQEAAGLYSVRARRRRELGLVDPAPVARLVDRELRQLGQDLEGDLVPPSTIDAMDRQSLTSMAAAAVTPSEQHD